MVNDRIDLPKGMVNDNLDSVKETIEANVESFNEKVNENVENIAKIGIGNGYSRNSFFIEIHDCGLFCRCR